MVEKNNNTKTIKSERKIVKKIIRLRFLSEEKKQTTTYII